MGRWRDAERTNNGSGKRLFLYSDINCKEMQIHIFTVEGTGQTTSQLCCYSGLHED